MRNHIIAIALCGLTACAPAPKNVKPLPVAAGTYSAHSCPSLRHQRNILNERVAGLTKAQRATRNGDIAGVILLGLPLGRMSGGNVADELGQAKGEQLAVNQEIAVKGC